MSFSFLQFQKDLIMNLAVSYIFVLTTYVVFNLIFGLSSTMPVHSSYQIKVFFPEERDALMQIRDSVSSTLDLHGNWTGPPCNQNLGRWAGIICSNWHVVGLVLEGIQLTGSLPPTFLQNISFLANLSFRNNSIYGPLPNLSNLVSLESVFFSYNRFTGPIPSEYIELPNLKQLELQQNYLDGEIPPFDQPTLTFFNVSYNHLQGSIPDTGVLQRFSESSYDYNSNLCGIPLEPCPVLPLPPLIPLPSPHISPPQSKKRKLPIWIIVLVAVVSTLVALVVMFVFLRCYMKAQEKETPKEHQAGEDGSSEWTDKKMAHSRSTEDPERSVELQFFDLNVPVFDLDDLLRASAEVLGKGELGTTYKANLESETRGVGRIPLNWAARFSIIKDIAKGMAFLHQSLPSHKVPHANLKSSNVLIHRDRQSYHSKLTNYGFLPLLPTRKLSKRLAAGRSPEFCQGKKLTHKTDVYCFGIILLEVITGKIPGGTSPERSDDKTDDLSDWVRMVVNNDWSTEIVDVEILASREGHNEILKLTEIALQCADMAPEKRPQMSEVLTRIEEIDRTNREND
ncbi:hypothetical protein OIU76_027753 [Salix suchowensis]|nr:hypothetical protein OIU76_027753 [Salix suchowensis]